MDSKQRAKLKMYRTIERFGAENEERVAMIPLFEDAFRLFTTRVAAIGYATQQGDMVLKGLQDGVPVREILCRAGADLAAAIAIYARQQQDKELEQQADCTFFELIYSMDQEMDAKLTDIHKTGMSRLSELQGTGLTEGLFELFGKLLESYRKHSGKIRNPAGVRREIRMRQYYLFEEAEKVLKQRLDKTIQLYKEAHPEFVYNYKYSRLNLYPSCPSTQITGTIRCNQKKIPIPGALFRIESEGLSTHTDLRGRYHIKEIPEGIVTIIVDAPGYVKSRNNGILIKRGLIAHLDIAITPQQIES